MRLQQHCNHWVSQKVFLFVFTVCIPADLSALRKDWIDTNILFINGNIYGGIDTFIKICFEHKKKNLCKILFLVIESESYFTHMTYFLWNRGLLMVIGHRRTWTPVTPEETQVPCWSFKKVLSIRSFLGSYKDLYT